MKATKNLLAAVALSVGLLSASGVNAALTSALGGQVVNDTEFGITWLADANLAASNTFGVTGINTNGTMNWNTAQSWIGGMNTANYLGFNDWRLPTSDTCFGYNCTGSEMGHLFYNELGGVAGSSILSSLDPDLALFQNVRYLYWSDTEWASNTTGAWVFHSNSGYQNVYTKTSNLLAWAVRPGQVAVAVIPEPETYAMLLAGLGLVGFMVRRRKCLAV